MDAGKPNQAMQFSIVVPAYNGADHIEAALHRLLTLNAHGFAYQVIVVDDASTDNTLAIAQRLTHQYPHLTVIGSAKNGGPGIARNLGVQHSQGAWVLFVDSDDQLVPDALVQLHNAIQQTPELDIIGFNWQYTHVAETTPIGQKHKGARQDGGWLQQPKDTLISKYLRLQMDGSVIYTAMRRTLLVEHAIRFADGYHEDVDYIYQVYWYAQHPLYLNEVLYLKQSREGSIVNTISDKHLYGFLRAWHAIAHFTQQQDAAKWQALRAQHAIGLVAVLATRVREIVRRATDLSHAASLYETLFDALNDNLDFMDTPEVLRLHTKYVMIARHFIDTFQSDSGPHAAPSSLSKAEELNAFVNDVMHKTWSCIDLHHSVFLAPDQIRTCCKRFFVEGEMRGDVALLDVPTDQPTIVSPQRILKAKQQLHTQINAGEASGCDGCPFLEFKDWGPLDTLQIKYLSFEYHSVCNLKCTYCSDTYFGGKQANYDVKRLLDQLLDAHALEACGTVVWGGGEPVVGKDFDAMLEKTVARIPNATQRVLTNSVKHNKTVQRLVDEAKVAVTTSIDAGSDATYKEVRGMASLRKAMKHLQRYAAHHPEQVTVKYIFTEGNCSLEEVRGFIALVKEYQLLDCNFQISCDFKHETIALDAVIAMIAMYGLLTDAGCGLVFFDDLLRQRLSQAHNDSEKHIRQALAQMGLGHILADRTAYRKVAIWGAGWQSKYLIEKTSFFRDVDVAYFIDSRKSRIGERFMEHDIVGPDTLLGSDIPVVIAAVQNLPIIYRSFKELGLDESRLVKQLII